MFGRQVLGVCLGFVGSVALIFTCSVAFAQDPVVQWTFDEVAGGTTDALDTGTAPDTTGVLGATATRTTDTPGGGPGFALDISAAGGGTSIVDGGNPIEADALAQFTFSTWLKVTGETDYNDGGGNVRILAKQVSNAFFDGFSWNINPPQLGAERSNNAFTMGMFIGGDTDFAFSYANEDILDRGGDWLFLATTYDGNSTTDNTKFYIGDETTAVSQLGTTLTIDAGPVFSTNTSNGGTDDGRFAIALTDAAPAADVALTGYQDDLRVYDSVLDLAALDAVRLANLPAAGLAGDYNENDIVDAADLARQRRNQRHVAQRSDRRHDRISPLRSMEERLRQHGRCGRRGRRSRTEHLWSDIAWIGNGRLGPWSPPAATAQLVACVFILGLI